MRLGQGARSLFLGEFLAAFGLSVRYMFKPRATLNYPNEKTPLFPTNVYRPTTNVRLISATTTTPFVSGPPVA